VELLKVVEDLEQTPEGRLHRNRHGPIPRATDREISCPSAGKSESAYREVGMSASTFIITEHRPTYRQLDRDNLRAAQGVVRS